MLNYFQNLYKPNRIISNLTIIMMKSSYSLKFMIEYFNYNEDSLIKETDYISQDVEIYYLLKIDRKCKLIS